MDSSNVWKYFILENIILRDNQIHTTFDHFKITTNEPAASTLAAIQ